MTLRQFMVELSRLPDEAELRRLFTRCTDVCVVSSPRRAVATMLVDRHAPSIVDAIVSAIRDLDTVGVVPVTVLPDDDLVTIDVIADRTGLPTQVVGAWATADEGPGDFPQPVTDELYRWSEVAQWFRVRADSHRPEPVAGWEALGGTADELEPTFTAVNLALRLRALAPRVERIAAIRGLLSG